MRNSASTALPRSGLFCLHPLKETIQEEFWKECKNVLDLEKDVIIVEFVEDFIPLSKSGKYKIIERRTNNGRKTIY